MRVLSLCAGIGGFDLAAEWAGMEVVGQVEIDPFCIRVLEKHWPHVPRVRDIFDVKGDEFGSVDLITAGFPCQPYSLAGKRGGASDDRAIWPEVRRVVEVTRPRWCCFENVAGLISMGLDDCLADLEGLGYEAGAVVLPACAVGAWHRRDRVWIIAHANGGGRGSIGITGMGRPLVRGGDDSPDATASAYTGAHAHPAGGGLRCGGAPGDARQPALAREVVPDAARELFNGGWGARHGWAESPDGNGRGAQSRLGGVAARLPAGLDGYWDREPDIPRVATGVTNRVGRLKALGNSIVPQVAYQILAEIMAIEHGEHLG